MKTSSAQKTTKITVNNITAKGYETVVLKATVASGSTYVNGGTVAFKIDGNTVGHANITNGKAVLSYTLPEYSSGTYKITVVYGGTSTYKSSTSTGSLKVTKDTSTTSVKSVTGYSGKEVRILAVVKSSAGTYAHGGTVSFKLNGLTIGSAKVSNGGAAIYYTIPASLSKSSYNITAVYSGTGTYSSSEGNGKLYVRYTTTSVKSVTGYSGNTVRILAVVKSSTGSYVHGGKVAFKLNGLTIGTASISNGGAAIYYTIPASLSKSSYNITAVYSGTSTYSSSEGNGKLSIVYPNSTKTTVTNVTATKSSTVKINATVKTTSGTNVNGGIVVFKLNGLTIGSASVSSGVASISYTIPSTFSKTSYTITAIYGGNTNNKASNATGKLSISTSNIPSSYKKYLVATTNCQVNSETIQNLAKTITAGCTSDLAKAKAIFNYLNDKTSYTYYSNTKYGALTTWSKKTGNCVDLTHLLIAVSRAAGLPAIYVHGKNCVFRSGLVVGHVWAKIYADGTWYQCDISSNYNSFGKIVNWNSCSSRVEYISLPF